MTWLSGLDALDCLFNYVSTLWPYDRLCLQLRFTWIYAAIASTSVILAGILPALFITSDKNIWTEKSGLRKLNRLLSFAVGSLLGDVFLHLLPETWATSKDTTCTGLWVIFGLMLCYVVEKTAGKAADDQHKVTAFMNLVANLIDNFSHGLAVGGSFQHSIRVGLMTTLAILLHEIPHEIGDFAILLRANFDRWKAVKAQLLTSAGGVLGATVALISSRTAEGGWDAQGAVSWILPFTAGGFLNIALVQVLPELLQETNVKESVIHMLLMLSGVAIMALVTIVAL